ncbi:heavy-metal-associated domain-containing protein [Georgenia muralis]|uniref:Copper chaperone CopZ n=1 Tax=Georgenia muralis TaxID=154117 RepID=A0A3N4ZCC1_9MICO|nr:heavy metal-associated domain-containing protein [Georgenia muralis]RPF28960.1 copper chaperone CopZ [Georgenia muralis]
MTTSTTHTVLRAEGFTCPSCVTKIDKQVRRLDGVSAVTVHFASGRIEIDHDPTLAGVPALVDAVGRAGYTARPATF